MKPVSDRRIDKRSGFSLKADFNGLRSWTACNSLATPHPIDMYRACVSVSSKLQCKHWFTLRIAALQGNKQKEGVHLVIPPAFANFFIASTSAGAALVGLLFVAVSLAPEQIVTRRAPQERQAVAGSAFTALINAFFISLAALIPNVNFGLVVVPISGFCLVIRLIQAWPLLRQRKGWLSFLRRAFLVVLSIGLYGLELLNGYQLLMAPSQVGIVYGLVSCLIGAFAVGLVRAWELLGAQRYGLMGWLSPLRDLPDTESFARAGNSHSAGEHSITDETTPRSPSQ
jgi:hypothetical protein